MRVRNGTGEAIADDRAQRIRRGNQGGGDVWLKKSKALKIYSMTSATRIKAHNGRGMVEASLREVGAGRSIVTDREGRVYNCKLV